LQGVCIAILINYNKTYEAAGNNIAREVTGWTEKKYKGVEDYFRLKAENDRLANENAKLRQMLAGNFQGPDTTKTFFIDSLVRDTTGKIRKYTWLPAKVVNNSISSQTNFITLERGSKQGILPNMIVVAPGNTMVGRVISTSENYSIVMSLLHRNSKVSSMLKKDGNAGILEWDGKSPAFLTLRNIPKSAKVVKGDTVLTSNYARYPFLMVGRVAAIEADPSSNFFTLKITPATNFSAIQHVYLVENMLYAEQKQLETRALDNDQ
jgi:rod shape-determining protein MreC